MKDKGGHIRDNTTLPVPSLLEQWQRQRVLYATVSAITLWLAFWAYGPALHGPFLFDDFLIPMFRGPRFRADSTGSLLLWIDGMRPLLKLTYWVNYRLFGVHAASFHVANLLIHCIASVLVFLITRRLLLLANTPAFQCTFFSWFAAAIFLVHPVQTEAVAYIAGRSETLSVTLAFAALNIFLCRRDAPMTWKVSIAVAALFAAATLSKEHTIAMSIVFPFTDLWWNPGSLRQRLCACWRLYVLMGLAAVGTFVFYWRPITGSNSAGFALRDFTWYQYSFTQCRALFVYPSKFVMPMNLTADWDFPISRTLLEHGAIVGLLVLVGLVVMAVALRGRFPLATYGFIAYVLLMAPTCSILPISDVFAERRLYFSMVGLLLITIDIVTRLRIKRSTLAGCCGTVVLLAAVATHTRAAIWGDDIALWQDTAAKSPNKVRPHLNLGVAYGQSGKFELAVTEYEKAAQLDSPSALLLLDWALAYEGMNQHGRALEKLHEAAAKAPPRMLAAKIYSVIGLICLRQLHLRESLLALAVAERMNPEDPLTYDYRGDVHLIQGEFDDAVRDFERALMLDPTLQEVRHDLATAQARLRPLR